MKKTTFLLILIAVFTLSLSPLQDYNEQPARREKEEIWILEDIWKYEHGADSQNDTIVIVIDEKGDVIEINDEGYLMEIENGRVIMAFKITITGGASKANKKVIKKPGKRMIGMNIQRVLNKIYETGKKIIVKLQTDKTDSDSLPPPTPSPKSYSYMFDVSKEKLILESIPVFTGQLVQYDFKKLHDKMAAEALKKEDISLRVIFYVRKKLGEITLTQSGVRYKITITRYDSEEDRLRRKKDKSAVIFEHGFETYAKYYLGMNVGILFPVKASTNYGLLYNGPDDEKPIITEDENYEIRMLIYGSIYPWGYEPEKPISRNGLNRLHFDLGTELSANIFKKIYVGFGYNFSRHFSLSVFACLGNVGELKEGFQKDAQVNPEMESVPLKYKFRPTFGIAVSLPFDIAKNWLGGVLGIK